MKEYKLNHKKRPPGFWPGKVPLIIGNKVRTIAAPNQFIKVE
jgi:hypothetical protein